MENKKTSTSVPVSGNMLEPPKRPSDWTDEQWNDYIFHCMNDIPKAQKEFELIDEPGRTEAEKYIEQLQEIERKLSRL